MTLPETTTPAALAEHMGVSERYVRGLARKLAICNPLVKNRDTLTEIVQKVRAIPKAEIKKLTMGDLPKYGLTLFCGA